MVAAHEPVLAERSLFAGLIDDAAVFPPGSASLANALSDHVRRRTTASADLVGPLLLPTTAVAEAAALAEPFGPISVGLIARPGVPASDLLAAVDLARDSALRVVGLEVGSAADWRTLGHLSVPLSVEVPRGEDQAAVLETVADAARESAAGPNPSLVQAKFRTGSTQSWAWPDEGELAAFVRSSIDLDLGFKLTGGLHHAVRGNAPERPGGPPTDHHGLLNVLLAVRWALNGAEVEELAEILADRNPVTLVDGIARMSTADAAIVRAFFTSYGCCTVTEPIAELAALNLLPPEDR